MLIRHSGGQINLREVLAECTESHVAQIYFSEWLTLPDLRQYTYF